MPCSLVEADGIFEVSTAAIIRAVIKLWNIKWDRHVAHTEKLRNAYNIVAGTYIRKTELGRSGHRWEQYYCKLTAVLQCKLHATALIK